MNRVHINTNDTHFIGCWDIQNKKLCNDLINFFDVNKDMQQEGITSGGKIIEAKSRVDISIKPHDLKDKKFHVFNQFFGTLHNCYKDYLE